MSTLIEKIDNCGFALTELRNLAIVSENYVFASRQYAAFLNALYDLTEIEALYDATTDAARDAGFDADDGTLAALPRVTTPVRKLDPAVWGKLA